MKGKLYISLILCLWGISSIHAQHEAVKAVFDQVTKEYEVTDTHHIHLKYTMYRGFTGNTSTESYTGTLVKKEHFSSFSMLNAELLQFSDAQLTIHHDTKHMIYTTSGTDILKASPLQMNQFLAHFEQSGTYEKKGIVYCELVSTKPKMQFPYGKIVIQIDKKSHRVLQQELFFNTQIPFASSEKAGTEMDFGRLVITLTELTKTPPKVSKLEDFIRFSKANTVEVSPQYAQYTLTHEK